VRRFAHENGLSLFFLGLFVVTVVGESFAGQHAESAERGEHGEHGEHGERAVSWWSYITSADFGGAVMANWQSEFLQFSLFIAATVWLVQKGSTESSLLGDVGLESDARQQVGRFTPADGPDSARGNDLRTRAYENSLLIVMTSIFVATWFGQSLNNWRAFNQEQAVRDEQALSWGRYLLNPDFWENTLQNWQSEFLAVGTMVVITIYLRQRGSPESKPVGAPHDETGSSG
jgi:hypothetical protein